MKNLEPVNALVARKAKEEMTNDMNELYAWLLQNKPSLLRALDKLRLTWEKTEAQIENENKKFGNTKDVYNEPWCFVIGSAMTSPVGHHQKDFVESMHHIYFDVIAERIVSKLEQLETI